MYLQYYGGIFFAIPYLGLSVGIIPSLAIGLAAFGAGELMLHDKENKIVITQSNNNMYEVLTDAKNKNEQIKKIALLIEDKEVVECIKEINDTVSKIINTIERKPEKFNKVNNFFDYYLPVTIKILKKYDEIENQRLQAEESQKFMESSKKMIIKTNNAFKKQLSNLYQSDIIDTDAEMKVFEAQLKSDGFNDDEDFNVK